MKQASTSPPVIKEFGFPRARNQKELSFGVTRN
jgi:hypothetical protein